MFVERLRICSKALGGIGTLAGTALSAINYFESLEKTRQYLGLQDNPLVPIRAPRPVLVRCDAYAKDVHVSVDTATKLLLGDKPVFRWLWWARGKIGLGGYFSDDVSLFSPEERVAHGSGCEPWAVWRDGVDRVLDEDDAVRGSRRLVLNGNAPHALWMYIGYKLRGTRAQDVCVLHGPHDKEPTTVFRITGGTAAVSESHSETKTRPPFFSRTTVQSPPRRSLWPGGSPPSPEAEIIYVATNPRNTFSRASADGLGLDRAVITFLSASNGDRPLHLDADSFADACADLTEYFATRDNHPRTLYVSTSSLTPLALFLGYSLNLNRLNGPVTLLDKVQRQAGHIVAYTLGSPSS